MRDLLLDMQRFPGRKWLRVAASSDHVPFTELPTLETWIRVRWARHLGVNPADLVLFSGPTQATRAILHALVTPADVVVLAEPTSWPAAQTVLGIGARFVEVGRSTLAAEAAGAWRSGAAEMALAVHPDAVVLLESPNVGGGDDRLSLDTLPFRAAVVDWRQHPTARGPGPVGLSSLAAPTFHVVVLRDPDDLTQPVLAACVAPAGQGDLLRAISGASDISPSVLQHALAVLDGLGQLSGWEATVTAAWTARLGEWNALVHGLPQMLALPCAGMAATALLLDQEAGLEAVLAALRPRFPDTALGLQAGPRVWLTSNLGHLGPATLLDRLG